MASRNLILSLSKDETPPIIAKAPGYSLTDIHRLACTFWMLSSQPSSLSETKLSEP